MDSPYGYYDFSEADDTVADSDVTSLSPQETLKRYWGYSNFRPLQAEIVQSVLDGRDTIGLLPTGGGKSITFQVPALMLPGITLVITPLISLMKDQVDNLRRRHIAAAYLHGGMSRAESDYAYERCRSGRVKMLYVAPERAASDAFMARIAGWNVALIVVDEAHCISQWGYDFRPSYMRLTALREKFPQAPVLALTASATPRVVDDIESRLAMNKPARFAMSFTRGNIHFLVRKTTDKYGKLLEILQKTTGSTIVYVRSRKKAADLAAMLSREGIVAMHYHAGLESREKARCQECWQSGSTRVIVATTAFGMGIDKADVRLVVHYDIPTTLEEYYQEAGRAGRDGKDAVAVLLAGNRDKATLKQRLARAFPEKDFIRHIYDEICRYLVLPMGEGFGAIFDFRPADFCTKYHLEQRAVEGAIGIIARSGYFDFIEEMDIEAKAMIRLRSAELYQLDQEPAQEQVLDFMLRNYPGLFTEQVDINEDRIARECGMTRMQVVDILKEMRRQHIISYIPRRTTAQLFFTANRVPSDRLTFPTAVYDDRREAMAAQIEAMTAFAYDDSRCRVAGMLRYFGEDDAEDCGKCDVCRARRRTAETFDTEAFEQRLDEFFRQISPCRWLDVYSLRPHYPHTFDKVAAHIAEMGREGRLEIDGYLIAKKPSDG